MANTIKLRRSATSGAVPGTSALALGELAMNTYDGKLFMKTDQSGTEEIVEIGAGGKITISSTTPVIADSEVGDVFWDSNSGNPYILYDDGNGAAQWVALVATASGAVADIITEGNTKAEVEDNGSDGHFKVTTENVERFRVDASGNVGINTTTPQVTLDINATDAVALPHGTTQQRPTSAIASNLRGYIRFNSSISQFEGHNGSDWASVGGGATGGGSDAWVVETDQTVTTSYELSAGKHGTTVSPTINSGATVTVPSGATLVIL